MLHQEREIGGLRLRIDRTLCVGFGDCLDEAPGYFELDDEGVVVFIDGAPPAGETALRAACDACPVDALTLFGTDGTQLAP